MEFVIDYHVIIAKTYYVPYYYLKIHSSYIIIEFIMD